MFGGQNDNAQTPPPGGGVSQSGALRGVDDLTASIDAASRAQPQSNNDPTRQDDAPNDSQNSAPSGAPAPADGMLTEGDDELLELKKQALQQLMPIVGHIDQTPEEKFRTLMMLIQASDNQELLKDAYETASTIEDEKVKAQALLDVVNEINYFAQNKNQGGQANTDTP